MKNLLTLLFFTIMTLNVNLASATVLSERNTVSLDADFNMKSVMKVQTEIFSKSVELRDDEKINLVIFSPGGSIIAGNNLIQFMNDLGREYNIICKFCASMAFHTFQGVNNANRFLTSDGILMTHKAKGGFAGSFPGQVDAIYNLWVNIITKMDQQVVKKTSGKHTLKSYRDLYDDDYWCNGEDCIGQGFADKVESVSCDKTLTGLTSRNIKFFGRDVKLFFNKCPLIRGIVNYEFVDKEDMETNEVQNLSRKFERIINQKKQEELLLYNNADFIKKINTWKPTI